MTTSDDVFAPVTVSTGLPPFDRLLGGGFRPGLTVLAGITGSGKSALASQIATGAATFAQEHQLDPVILVSYEMSRHEQLIRMILQAMELRDGYRPPVGFSAADQADAGRGLNAIRNLPLIIKADLPADVASLEAYLSSAEGSKCSLLVIDPLSMLGAASPTDANSKAEMAAVVKELRTLARRLELPILLVSHLNRNANGRSPTLGDVPAASIEVDADMVLLLDRPSAYLADLEERIRIEKAGAPASLSLVKSRFGPLGTVELTWMASRLLFAPRI